jgi:sugar lactone lactonase YvrE
MAFDADGNLYVAVFGQQNVTVLDREGAVIARLATAGQLPTNVAFALPGGKRLYVTEYEFGRIEAFDTEVDGLPLFCGRAGEAVTA